MSQVQGSLLVCAWFAVAAQVMAWAKSLPHFSVQDSAVWTGAAGEFNLEVTLVTTNPREHCREQVCAGGLASCGDQWQRGTPQLRACQLPAFKSAAPSCAPDWELPVALGCFKLLCELWLDAVFRSLRAGWKKPAGPVAMDAILNCNPEDLEDYYNLLGCDELATVRASPSPPAYSQFERARVSAGNLQLLLCGQEYLKWLGNVLYCHL